MDGNLPIGPLVVKTHRRRFPISPRRRNASDRKATESSRPLRPLALPKRAR
jgi:hypothetical protein